MGPLSKLKRWSRPPSAGIDQSTYRAISRRYLYCCGFCEPRVGVVFNGIFSYIILIGFPFSVEALFHKFTPQIAVPVAIFETALFIVGFCIGVFASDVWCIRSYCATLAALGVAENVLAYLFIYYAVHPEKGPIYINDYEGTCTAPTIYDRCTYPMNVSGTKYTNGAVVVYMAICLLLTALCFINILRYVDFLTAIASARTDFQHAANIVFENGGEEDARGVSGLEWPGETAFSNEKHEENPAGLRSPLDDASKTLSELPPPATTPSAVSNTSKVIEI